jgi:hypothetical protein
MGLRELVAANQIGSSSKLGDLFRALAASAVGVVLGRGPFPDPRLLTFLPPCLKEPTRHIPLVEFPACS